MADLGTFSRRMEVLARRAGTGTDSTVQRVAVLVNQTVVTSTPVDTGRARANWYVGINRPVTEAMQEDKDPGGQQAIQRNNAKIATRKHPQTIYISNNLPYIGRLNEGYSAQAPAFFVQIAVALAVRHVRGARIL